MTLNTEINEKISHLYFRDYRDFEAKNKLNVFSMKLFPPSVSVLIEKFNEAKQAGIYREK